MMRRRCGDKVNEGDSKRVGQMIQAGEADIRLTRLELYYGPPAEASAIRQGSLADVSPDTEAMHVRGDMSQDGRCLSGLHVHYSALYDVNYVAHFESKAFA
jgi:hypothetical protein